MNAREQRLLDLIENLDQAHLTLDLVDFSAGDNVAEITLSEVEFVRSAMAAATTFICELEDEARTDGGAR
jgi:hypothetical protein